ncbi:MAG: PAS domain S-box protein [Desulfobacteraceae bacterium]|nr:PAS domain S-box protein [Desulfobacteraceae bacterium]
MLKFFKYMRTRTAFKLLFLMAVAAALLVCFTFWVWYSVRSGEEMPMIEKAALLLAVLTFAGAAVLIFFMGEQIARKQAALNKQKEKYRTLFELVPCEIAVLDTNFRLIHFNHRFAEKFNPKISEYCFQAYKGREQKCEPCPVEKTFEDGLPHFSEETGYAKDGTTAHWLVVTSPQKDEDTGAVTAALEMTVDLTDLKLLEDKLKKSEKKYKDIFNNIANPIFVIDREDLTILDCNKSVQRVYGYSKSEVCGTRFTDLFIADDRAYYERLMKTRDEIHQARHLRKSEKALFVNIRISPSEYEGKSVYLVTTSDITQRLEAEQQLIQASKMATLGEMATGVAHELNQPLSVIKTASSYLMKKIRNNAPITDENLYTMASEIDSHINRATKIINHMREFGRKSEIDTENINVNPVIENAFDIFAQQLKLRGIDVVWELAPELPSVKADASKLEQVIINLLVNARDAIEARWGQRPSDKDAADKKILLRSHSDGRFVTIEVEDTGSGIPPDLVDKIFEPFFTTKDAGKGTGLGLSISYSILREWGAAIHAESGRSQGTRFIIRFPVPRQNTPPPEGA